VTKNEQNWTETKTKSDETAGADKLTKVSFNSAAVKATKADGKVATPSTSVRPEKEVKNLDKTGRGKVEKNQEKVFDQIGQKNASLTTNH
jgi:hypothetical protein